MQNEKKQEEIIPFFTRLPEDLVEKIDEKAKEHHLSKNDVIKLILADFFRKGGKLVL